MEKFHGNGTKSGNGGGWSCWGLVKALPVLLLEIWDFEM